MSTSARLLVVLGCALSLVVAFGLLGDETSREAQEILARGPLTPNPVLSFLPAGVEGDWQYWNARMGVDAHLRRQLTLQRGASRGLGVLEIEAPGALAENDLPILGQQILGVGTSPGDMASVRIRGALLAPPRDLPPAMEPDTSIPEAHDLNLVAGEVVGIAGVIGDGNSPRADFDFFSCTVAAGQRLQIAVRTPDPTAPLDPIVGLYNSAGTLVAANDNRPVNGVLQDRDSLLEVTVEVPGTYFVAVGGFNPIGGGDLAPQFPSNPSNATTAPPPGSQGEYRLLVGLDAPPSFDRDFYRLFLRAGDVVGALVEGGGAGVSVIPVREDGDSTPLVLARSSNLTAVYPEATPLPVGGRAAVAVVIDADGEYAVGAEAAPDFDLGTYTLDVTVARPPLGASASSRKQILFLDLDGATVDPALFGFPPGSAQLSPFASFLERWGLEPGDENAAVDAVLSVVTENLSEDLRTQGLDPTFDLEIRNSRDHQDPFGQPDVSRIILGGTIEELGIGTIGIAESVDVGNFATAETGIVLLDLLSAEAPDPNSLNTLERDPSASMIQLVGAGVGAIAAHEAGHLFANFHTDRGPGPANIMDRGGNLPRFLGLGEDQIFGTADDLDPDFGDDIYEPAEGLAGIEDTLNSISFDLGSGGLRPILTLVPSTASETLDLGAVSLGGTARQDLVLGNAGTASLTVAAVSLREVTGGGFSLEIPPLPIDLAPGSKQAFAVLFSPTATGPAAARLRISTSTLSNEKGLLLTGQGGLPASSASPLAHNFGAVEYSEADPTRTFTFEIRNGAAAGDLQLLPPLLVGQAPDQYDARAAFPETGAARGSGVVVPPGGSLLVPITFRPTGLVGSLDATAVLRTNDPSSSRIFLDLQGQANGPDVDVLPRAGLFFSPVRPGTSQTRSMNLMNLGNRDLEIVTVNLSGPDTDQFLFTPPPLPLILGPGTERRFSFEFSPTSLGVKTASLELSSNDPDEGISVHPLGGLGAEPDVLVAEGAGDFGRVRPGSRKDQIIEVENVGAFRMRVSETVISGPHAGEFRITSGSAPFTVSSGIAWPLGMRFQPNGEGLREATLTITSDDPDQPQLEVPLSGVGALPALSLTKECEAVLAPIAGDSVVICVLEVMSLGPGTAPGVRVEDLLPEGLPFLEDSCGAGLPLPGEPWTWTLGSLTEGESTACDLTLSIGPEAPATVLNTATATTALQAAGDPAATASALIDLRRNVEIPTLNPLGLAFLALLLAGLAMVLLRRQRAFYPPEGKSPRRRDT